MLHAAVSIQALYHYLITNYFNPVGLLQDIWSINILGDPVLHSIAKAILSSAAAIDLTIAFTLSYYLHAHRTGVKQYNVHRVFSFLSADIYHRTDKLINRLMVITINNGILTSTLDIVTLALVSSIGLYERHILNTTQVIARSKDLLFFALSQVLATLYSNSLLATLNSRESLKDNHERDVVASTALMSMDFGARTFTGTIPPPGRI
ncbi:hypothetical protein CVT26_010677 [Gymnopilus dilepis]|uniref:DUF6534 domain-containing protein n=1 Tax=Gymnopilus dilepis TaxID=231916 RepID=A0A409Y0V7_9AGAR|nr:hypothetical protein CVT26_010677 [Gymnopilus dilepis]